MKSREILAVKGDEGLELRMKLFKNF